MKRPIESESEEEVRKTLQKTDGRIINKWIEYLHKTDDKKLRLGLDALKYLPEDLKRLIGKLEPTFLLTLSQTNKFMYELSKTDSVWRDMFRRHFPIDWRVCGGNLPFYVLYPEHPFVTAVLRNGESIDPLIFDNLPWRRFYLVIRQYYMNESKVSKTFDEAYQAYFTIDRLHKHRKEIAHTFIMRIMWGVTGMKDNDNDPLFSYEISIADIDRDLPFLKRYVNSVDNLFTAEDRREYLLYFQNSGDHPFVNANNQKTYIQYFTYLFDECKGAYENYCALTNVLDLKVDHAYTFITWNMYSKDIIDSLKPYLPITALNGDIIRLITLSPQSCIGSDQPYSNNVVKCLSGLHISFRDVLRTKEGKIRLSQSCVNCNVAVAKFKCGDCGDAVYCGRICQSAHWENHQKICQKSQMIPQI